MMEERTRDLLPDDIYTLVCNYFNRYNVPSYTDLTNFIRNERPLTYLEFLSVNQVLFYFYEYKAYFEGTNVSNGDFYLYRHILENDDYRAVPNYSLSLAKTQLMGVYYKRFLSWIYK